MLSADRRDVAAREARLFGIDPGGFGDLGGAIDTMDDDASVVAHRNAGRRVDLREVEALTRIRGERQSDGGVDQTLSRWSALDRRRIVGHDVGARGTR